MYLLVLFEMKFKHIHICFWTFFWFFYWWMWPYHFKCIFNPHFELGCVT